MDASLYRSAYREIAAWSRAADALDAAIQIEPAEAWRRTIELSTLCRQLAPEPTAAELYEQSRERARAVLRMCVFEARRSRHRHP